MDWKKEIQEYSPINDQEKKDQEMMVWAINGLPEVLTRKSIVGHFTATAFVLNEAKTKTLMVYHNIYDSWSWTGGHVDGDADFYYVAIKELEEETGLKPIRKLKDGIFSLDVIQVLGHQKKGAYVSPHLHFSVTYLVEGRESDPLMVKEDENSGVAWISLDEIETFSTEPHMVTIYKKLVEKIRKG